MLLYIILCVVLFIMFFRNVPREGFFMGIEDSNQKWVNLPDSLQTTCKRTRNTIDLIRDDTRNVYTNDNDAIYNNYQNILAYAAGFC